MYQYLLKKAVNKSSRELEQLSWRPCTRFSASQYPIPPGWPFSEAWSSANSNHSANMRISFACKKLRHFVQVYGPTYQDVPFRKAMIRKSASVRASAFHGRCKSFTLASQNNEKSERKERTISLLGCNLYHSSCFSQIGFPWGSKVSIWQVQSHPRHFLFHRRLLRICKWWVFTVNASIPFDANLWAMKHSAPYLLGTNSQRHQISGFWIIYSLPFRADTNLKENVLEFWRIPTPYVSLG